MFYNSKGDNISSLQYDWSIITQNKMHKFEVRCGDFKEVYIPCNHYPSQEKNISNTQKIPSSGFAVSILIPFLKHPGK